MPAPTNLSAPWQMARISKAASVESTPRPVIKPLLEGGILAGEEEEEDGRRRLGATVSPQPTALWWHPPSPWLPPHPGKKQGGDFHVHFFRRDGSFQRTLFPPSLMPSMKKARVETRSEGKGMHRTR